MWSISCSLCIVSVITIICQYYLFGITSLATLETYQLYTFMVHDLMNEWVQTAQDTIDSFNRRFLNIYQLCIHVVCTWEEWRYVLQYLVNLSQVFGHHKTVWQDVWIQRTVPAWRNGICLIWIEQANHTAQWHKYGLPIHAIYPLFGSTIWWSTTIDTYLSVSVGAVLEMFVWWQMPLPKWD